ncbi:glycosyltransferase [Streptomyces sp. NPDC007851]|uniref:glycosyltransferase n=1 Tax=Streptomyces sp. NPDC007851 TaxID=3155008 RepID=UPI0033C02E26
MNGTRVGSKRILIITAGSRGDVAPFTGLGRRLLDVGHQVTVAAHPSLAALVGGCGLGYRPVPGNPQGLIRDLARAASRDEAQGLTRAYADGLADGVAEAVAGGADLLLTAHCFRPGTAQPDRRRRIRRPRHRHLPRTVLRHRRVPAAQRTEHR